MLATVLDRAIGLAVSRAIEDRPQATLQLDIHFMQPVQIGEFVQVHCAIHRITRSLVFASGTAFVDSKAVCSGKGVWKILDPVRPAQTI